MCVTAAYKLCGRFLLQNHWCTLWNDVSDWKYSMFMMHSRYVLSTAAVYFPVLHRAEKYA